MLLLMSVFGITLIVSCAYKGNVNITMEDSLRLLSPDFDARMRAKSEITKHENCQKKKLEKSKEN